MVNSAKVNGVNIGGD